VHFVVVCTLQFQHIVCVFTLCTYVGVWQWTLFPKPSQTHTQFLLILVQIWVFTLLKVT